MHQDTLDSSPPPSDWSGHLKLGVVCSLSDSSVSLGDLSQSYSGES